MALLPQGLHPLPPTGHPLQSSQTQRLGQSHQRLERCRSKVKTLVYTLFKIVRLWDDGSQSNGQTGTA